LKISRRSPIEEGLMQPLALTEEGLMHASPRKLAVPPPRSPFINMHRILLSAFELKSKCVIFFPTTCGNST